MLFLFLIYIVCLLNVKLSPLSQKTVPTLSFYRHNWPTFYLVFIVSKQCWLYIKDYVYCVLTECKVFSSKSKGCAHISFLHSGIFLLCQGFTVYNSCPVFVYSNICLYLKHLSFAVVRE